MIWHVDIYGWHVCEPCDRSFNSHSAIMQHLNNASSHNYCDTCHRDFSTHSGLISHYAHSPRHAYCQTCDEHFDDSDELDEHMDDRHWWCRDCNQIFAGEENLQNHRRQSHADRYCDTCDRLFSTASRLRSHSTIHKAKDLPCLMRNCPRRFASPSDVVLHLESGTCSSGVNRHMIDAYVLKHDVRNVITNPRRMITAGSTHEYTPPPTYTATNRAWNGRSWECYFCHAEFPTIPQLNQHLASPKHSATANKIYKCPNSACGKCFAALSGLGQHIENGSCGVQRFKAVKSAIDDLMGGMRRLAL